MSARPRPSVILPIVISVLISLGISGCLWLAIPSLAYEGYEYEKKGSGSSAQVRRSHATPSPTPELE